MPADEVTHGTSVGESRARSGPRHAAPKKPLLTRLNMPAGKAIALAAMPTAVLMGMGFTPTLTLARADDPTKLSLTADEYKDCVEALEAAEEGTDASATPTPTPTPSAEENTDSTDEDTSTDEGEDTSAGDDSADDSNSSGDSAADDTTTDDSASSDSGSDDKDSSTSDESKTDESKTDDTDKSATDTAGSGEAPSADTSGTDGGGNVLEDIGTAIEDLFTPDDKETETTPSTSTSPSPSPSPSDDASGSDEGKDDAGSDAGKDAKDTAGNASDKVEDAAKDVTDTAGDTEDAEKAAEDATDDATATPSPSPSESADTEGCPVATDDESGVEKGIPPLPNDPWYLNASSLLLKGADYKGVVKVKTADGSVKEVLKYVVSDGTDIGDLHQTVEDKQAGVTYHVQAGKGTTSTIREGKTVMYTESISGNLLGLIPVTFDPKHPPPLNIPLIYFTKVKVVQAGQFGGTLTVPGMHQFMTD